MIPDNIFVQNEVRKRHYQSLLHEAEQQRLVRELGSTETSRLRSIVARLRRWLSHLIFQKLPALRKHTDTTHAIGDGIVIPRVMTKDEGS
jgi:hypothetical protein